MYCMYVCMYVCMYASIGWMDGWMDGLDGLEGWMDCMMEGGREGGSTLSQGKIISCVMFKI